MKIALLLCPQWDTEMPVLSLALLSAQLKRHGHETAIYDMNQEMARLARAGGDTIFSQAPTLCAGWTDPDFVDQRVLPAYRDYLEAFVSRVLDGGTGLVGFSVYYSNSLMSLHVASLLKKRAPGVPIVFGGASCRTPRGCVEHLKTGLVDAAFLGEADLTFPAFADAFAGSGRLRAAGGVMLREAPATWKDAARPPADLNVLPHADFDGFNLAHYRGKTIQSSRGCIRKCVYCDHFDGREKYRSLTARRLFAEIKHQLRKDPQVSAFRFSDSLVNGSMKTISAFCGAVARGNLDIKWGGYAVARAEMTQEVLAKMRQGGCRLLAYGIESGSARVLRDMAKCVSPEVNARALRNTAGAGIDTLAGFMVGFPTETEEDFQRSLEFVRANARNIGLLGPSLFTLTEPLGRWAAYRVEPGPDALYWSTRDGKNTFPVRVERLRRLIAAAGDCGVRVAFEARVAPEAMETHYDGFLRRYRARAGARKTRKTKPPGFPGGL